MADKINEALLEEKLSALEKVRAWSPRVISRLESHIRSAEDSKLFRINPVQFAADKGIHEPETIDLFLHGAKIGLFQMAWQLLCPSCGQYLDNLESLRKIRQKVPCIMCHEEYQMDLDDLIRITFT